MPDRGDVKEKVKKIVKVLPELNCGKCGFDNCGKFARAVAEERAPCYGCVSGGPSVANKVCEIMEVRVPGIAKIPADYPGFPQPGIASSRMNRDRGRGPGGSQGMRRRPGSGKGFGRRRGKGF
ncbi:hypothetical protein J7K55_02750 [Candidatus Aerophobetes bacterium]|nr:hypothetical protein [Candidatus Aerophobetes bacterium]